MQVSLIAYTALSVAAAATSGWYALSQTAMEGESPLQVVGLQDFNDSEWEDQIFLKWESPLMEAEAFSTLESLVDSWDTEERVIRTLLASQLFLLCLVNLFFNFLVLMGALIQITFFENLRPLERRNVKQRLLAYVLWKFFFVCTVLEPGVPEIFLWLVWFGVLGLLHVFAMLSRDRYDYLVTHQVFAPKKIPVFLVGVLYVDLVWFTLFCVAFSEAGVSFILLMTFECGVLFLETLQILMKYVLAPLGEEASRWRYNTNLALEATVYLITLLHDFHILFLHGLGISPVDLFLLFQIRLLFINLKKKVQQIRNYHKLNNVLKDKYETVPPEELEGSGEICTICRDEMKEAKRLPCKHMFHEHCLRSWLQQHHDCPLCRTSLIDAPQNSNPQGGAPSFPFSLFSQRNQPQQPPFSQPQQQQQQQQQQENHPQEPRQDLQLREQQSIFEFSTNRVSWLPNFSISFVRGGRGIRPRGQSRGRGGLGAVLPRFLGIGNLDPAAIQNEVDRLVEVFPNIPREAIRRDLARSRSVERTTDNILENRIAIEMSDYASFRNAEVQQEEQREEQQREEQSEKEEEEEREGEQRRENGMEFEGEEFEGHDEQDKEKGKEKDCGCGNEKNSSPQREDSFMEDPASPFVEPLDEVD